MWHVVMILITCHPGEYAVFIRDLPNSLASLKWPFKEIPAQEHAGMTKLVHVGMTEGVASVG